MLNSPGEGGRLRDPSAHVAGVYAQDGPDIGFWRILHDLGQLTDERLAELIEEDGRMRIARGLPVTIERYREAVPDLLEQCDSVDAAIDVTLRYRCGGARCDAASVEELINEYPQLETMIREAVALNNAMRSSHEVNEEYPVRRRRVPQDFGPRMETGEARYELRRLLGLGSTGQVYLAIDRLLSEKDRPALVAIKVLNPSKRHTGYRQRLIAEARKARRVDHPNVVRVLDLGVTDQHEDYITYEYITGGDLFQWLQDQHGNTNPLDAAKLMAKVARGVQSAHSAGLVHCDLNPGNIILTDEGRPKIADFGVAIRAEEVKPLPMKADGKQLPVGNLLFVSPEQFRCEDGSLTVPSDVYALGGLLYTLLTGKLPNGNDEAEAERIHDTVTGRAQPPSVREMRPELDGDLDAICRRAMAVHPQDRYSSAGALADDLESWLRHEPIVWTRPSVMRIAKLWMQRKPAVAAISLLLAVSVVTLGGFAFNENQRRQQEEIRAVEAEQARQAEEFRAEVQRLRAEAETQKNVQAAQMLRSGMGFLNAISEGPSRTLFFPVLWNIEHFLDRNLLAASESPEELLSVRLQTVERLIEQAEQAGQGDYLEAMLWRSTLALWLVAKGDPPSLERADELLTRIESQCSETLDANDPWRSYISTVRASAQARQIMLHPSDAIDHETARRLEHCRDTLEQQEPNLYASDPASPLLALLHETLIEVHAYIGDHQASARAAARRDQIWSSR